MIYIKEINTFKFIDRSKYAKSYIIMVIYNNSELFLPFRFQEKHLFLTHLLIRLQFRKSKKFYK